VTKSHDVDQTLASRVAAMVLAAVEREYPSHILHVLFSDADVRPPRGLTPAFFGSFDWHSAVHGHWSLARLLNSDVSAGSPVEADSYAAHAMAVLGRAFTRERMEAERAYLEPRPGFERPYGLAWLLQLAAELREWGRNSAAAAEWARAVAPLERLAARRLDAWLARLPWPIRSGEHSQSAFALGLALDWARTAAPEPEAVALEARIVGRAADHHAGDRLAPIEYEPSGHDFLSPALGEADLMRRVLPRAEFASWLEGFLGDPARPALRRWLTPVQSPDRSDGKLAHLDGLNLSRAWMLEGIASALAPGATRAVLQEAAARHGEAGLAALEGDDYMGTHWLGSFALYLVTRRGISSGPR
jgi:hypothetical protein